MEQRNRVSGCDLVRASTEISNNLKVKRVMEGWFPKIRMKSKNKQEKMKHGQQTTVSSRSGGAKGI